MHTTHQDWSDSRKSSHDFGWRFSGENLKNDWNFNIIKKQLYQSRILRKFLSTLNFPLILKIWFYFFSRIKRLMRWASRSISSFFLLLRAKIKVVIHSINFNFKIMISILHKFYCDYCISQKTIKLYILECDYVLQILEKSSRNNWKSFFYRK